VPWAIAILETLDNQKVVARSTEFPDCPAIADSREEAIALMQQQLSERLKTIEVVSLSFPPVTPPNSELADSFGIFKDDPYFAEILQAMRDERELDADNPACT
jgi:predicted RNase H-like HicB family nuclease